MECSIDSAQQLAAGSVADHTHRTSSYLGYCSRRGLRPTELHTIEKKTLCPKIHTYQTQLEQVKARKCSTLLSLEVHLSLNCRRSVGY